MKLTCVGRSFFTPEMPSPISGGAEVWLGYYQSLRATQAGLTLNVDMSAMAFVRSMPMVSCVLLSCVYFFMCPKEGGLGWSSHGGFIFMYT